MFSQAVVPVPQWAACEQMHLYAVQAGKEPERCLLPVTSQRFDVFLFPCLEESNDTVTANVFSVSYLQIFTSSVTESI